MALEGALTYIHIGAFSGSAISLRQALQSRVPIFDYDLISVARKVSLLPFRLKAIGEAVRAGKRIPWTKTATWSTAVQRAVERDGLLTHHRPILFVQTLPAFVLDPSIRYGIYADRVSREGAAVGGVYPSRFTAGWINREEAFLRGAHRIFVMGPSTEGVLIRDYGIPSSRIMVVGAGPNVPSGSVVESDACRRLLFVGTDWRLKGGPELIQAFSDVRRDFPHLELLVVGSSPPGPLPEGVRAVGRVPHARMSEMYSQADAVVIATHMEAFGIALMEGLMRGLPCIATTVGNQPWIVQDAGICVDPGQVDALSAAMRELVTNYANFKQRARERGNQLRENFSWDRVASTILEHLLTPQGDRADVAAHRPGVCGTG